jgi:hypothetical protein
MIGVGNTAIVNINARANSENNTVELFLEAGIYDVNPIGIADGGAYDTWNAWSSTSCSDPYGCQRTIPTTVTGWMNNYCVKSSNFEFVEVDGAVLSPVNTPGSGLESFYYIDNYYLVTDGLVYPTALNALAGSQSSKFSLTTAGLVEFFIPDHSYALGDNSGGISLNIVPLPGAVWLLGSGLIGLVGFRRKMFFSKLSNKNKMKILYYLFVWIGLPDTNHD